MEGELRMEPQWDQHPYSVKKEVKNPIRRYLFSFAWMILFTIAAFYIVMKRPFSDPDTIFWTIVILAILQVILQLFTFMHLDWKHYRMAVIFITLAAIIAGISAWILGFDVVSLQ